MRGRCSTQEPCIVCLGAADQLTVMVDLHGVVHACGTDRGGEWLEMEPVQVKGALSVNEAKVVGVACGGCTHPWPLVDKY